MTHEIDDARMPQSPDGAIAQAAGKIFLCYRREDSAGHAGRIYDQLKRRFPGRVFMDVAGIGVGTRWAEVIEQTLGSCGVAVILIGRRWLERGPGGTRRIDDPQDPLRAEITTALRLELRIIPLLVAGAAVPQSDELPQDVAPIGDWQALRIDDDDFDHDSARLIEALERQLKGQGTPRPPKRRWMGLMAGLGAAIVVVTLGVLIASAGKTPTHVTPDVHIEDPTPTPKPRPAPIVDPTPKPAPAPIVDPTPKPEPLPSPSKPPAAPQLAGEYKLTSYTVQGAVIPLDASMRLVPISDGRFRFEMLGTHESCGEIRYSGLLERQGANWTMTIAESNPPTAYKGPFPTQVEFDGSTLVLQNVYASEVWQKQ